MSTTQHLEHFNMFAKNQLLVDAERSMDDLYFAWRQKTCEDSDSLAVQASIRDLENGERGHPIDEFLADFDRQRGASHT